MLGYLAVLAAICRPCVPVEQQCNRRSRKTNNFIATETKMYIAVNLNKTNT